jgi:Tfp pilus assembly protein PilO
MEDLIKKLMEAWDERPEREKTMFIGVGLFVVAWFSWSFVISANVKSAWAAHKLLTAAEAEYKESVYQHKNAAAFKRKLDGLESELKQKQVEEEEFNQKIKGQGQMEDLLEGLRSEADKSSLSLVTLDLKVTASTAPTPKTDDKDKTATQPESVSYKKNSIMLVCVGPYRQTVDYLLKIMSMPRVISLKSFSMGKVSASEGKEAGLKGAPASKPDTAVAVDSPVETRLELEVFFK